MSTRQSTVLIVDDEASARESMRLALNRDFRSLLAGDAEAALALLAAEPVDVVLLDIILDGASGLDLLERIRAEYPEVQVVMVTALKAVETAVQAMKRGAYEYVTKPFELDEIRIVVGKAVEETRLRQELSALQVHVRYQHGMGQLVGKCAAMQQVFHQLTKAVHSDCTVLLTGESGTGKELAARAVHFEGRRSSRPFVPLNSPAFTPELIESELFGHEKGAFTNAYRTKPGMFEVAEGGTLFLDEIGDMSPAIQAKLLRTIQERSIRRVGGLVEIPVDVRLILATHQDLDTLVASGRFRADLFYRINVFRVQMPPLRQRREDIPLLTQHFIAELSAQAGRPAPRLHARTLERLVEYDWPGNVRELANAIERALVIMDGDEILPGHLPAHVVAPEPGAAAPRAAAAPGGDGVWVSLQGESSLREITEEVERRAIERALAESAGVLTEAARRLGTTRRILRYKMDKLGIREP